MFDLIQLDYPFEAASRCNSTSLTSQNIRGEIAQMVEQAPSNRNFPSSNPDLKFKIVYCFTKEENFGDK